MEGIVSNDKIFKTKLFDDEAAIDLEATHKQKFYVKQKQNDTRIDQGYTLELPRQQQNVTNLAQQQYMNLQELKRLHKAYQIRQNELQTWTSQLKRLKYQISQNYICPKKLNDIYTETVMDEFKIQVKKTLSIKQKQIDELKSTMKSQITQIKDTKKHYEMETEKQKELFNSQLEVQLQNIQTNSQQIQKFQQNKYTQEIDILKEAQKKYIHEIDELQKSIQKKQTILEDQQIQNNQNFEASDINFCNEQKNQLENNIEILKKQYQSQIDQLQKEISILEVQNKQITEQSSAIIQNQQKNFQELKNNIEQSNKQLYNNIVTQKVEEANQRLLQKIEYNQQLEEKAEEMENEINTINENLQPQNQNIENYIQNELQQFEQEIQLKQEKIKSLEKGITNKENQFQQVISKIDKDFQEIQIDSRNFENFQITYEQQQTAEDLNNLEDQILYISEQKQQTLKRIDMMQRLECLKEQDLCYFYDQIKSKNYQFQFKFLKSLYQLNVNAIFFEYIVQRISKILHSIIQIRFLIRNVSPNGSFFLI